MIREEGKRSRNIFKTWKRATISDGRKTVNTNVSQARTIIIGKNKARQVKDVNPTTGDGAGENRIGAMLVTSRCDAKIRVGREERVWKNEVGLRGWKGRSVPVGDCMAVGGAPHLFLGGFWFGSHLRAQSQEGFGTVCNRCKWCQR